MEAINIKNSPSNLQTDEYILCPECGAIMNKVDQVKESRCIYTWFECSKTDCDGQWLQKYPF